jgi:hypothetical protein
MQWPFGRKTILRHLVSPNPAAGEPNRWALVLTSTTKPHLDFIKSKFDFPIA